MTEPDDSPAEKTAADMLASETAPLDAPIAPPPRKRPWPLALVAIAIPVAGIAVLAWLTMRDESAAWSRAEAEHSEVGWQRYQEYALGARTGLSGLIAPRVTPLDAHAALAAERVIAERVAAAIAHEDWPALCTLARQHENARAQAALDARIDRAVAAYRHAAARRHTPEPVVSAFVQGIEARKSGDRCADAILLRVTHEISSASELAQPVEAGRSVADVLRALPLAERGRVVGEALATELRRILLDAVQVRYVAEGDPAQGTLSVQVVVAIDPQDRFATPDGRELPGIELSVRDRVQPLRQEPAAPSSAGPEYTLPNSFAMEIYRESAAADVASVYGHMIDQLYPHVGERARQDLGIVPFHAGSAPVGSCAHVAPLPAGRSVSSTTSDGDPTEVGSCAAQEGATDRRERAFRLVVARPSEVAIAAAAEFDPVLYLRRECTNPGSELACRQRGPLTATLDPGVYHVFVDEPVAQQGGAFSILAAVRDSGAAAQACQGPPALALASDVNDSIEGASDRTQGTCGGTGGPERVYAVEIAERSRLRCTAQSALPAAIYLRRECAAFDSEVACASTPGASAITMTIDAGHYTLVVDGHDPSSHGPFGVRCDVAPADGTEGTAADGCADPGAITGSGDLVVDTFLARDDHSSRCGGSGAPDRIYRLEITRPTQLRAAWIGNGMRGSLAIMRECGVPASHIGCALEGETLSADLSPGTYFVVADGASAGQVGAGRVHIELTPAS